MVATLFAEVLHRGFASFSKNKHVVLCLIGVDIVLSLVIFEIVANYLDVFSKFALFLHKDLDNYALGTKFGLYSYRDH